MTARKRLETRAARAVVPEAAPAPAVLEQAPRTVLELRGELDRGVHEVNGYPLRLLAQLPVGCTATLVCRVFETGARVVLTTARAAYARARELGLPTFVGGELGLLALAAEHDRAGPAQVRTWLERKREVPTWKLDGHVAIGDVHEALAPKGWNVERVLAVLGMDLIAVGAGDEVPL